MLQDQQKKKKKLHDQPLFHGKRLYSSSGVPYWHSNNLEELIDEWIYFVMSKHENKKECFLFHYGLNNNPIKSNWSKYGKRMSIRPGMTDIKSSIIWDKIESFNNETLILISGSLLRDLINFKKIEINREISTTLEYWNGMSGITQHMKNWESGLTTFTCKFGNMHIINEAWEECGKIYSFDISNDVYPIEKVFTGDYGTIKKKHCDCNTKDNGILNIKYIENGFFINNDGDLCNPMEKNGGVWPMYSQWVQVDSGKIKVFFENELKNEAINETEFLKEKFHLEFQGGKTLIRGMKKPLLCKYKNGDTIIEHSL